MSISRRTALSALVATALVAACGESAPIEDGSFVTWRIGTTDVRVEFERDGGDFRVVGTVTEPDGSTSASEETPGFGAVVDTRLRTSGRAPLEVASFGPVWVAPGDLVEGGRAYGSPVAEVRSEGGRDLAVVRAAIGGLSGEWVYDVRTGFLVSGSIPGGTEFGLVETNVTGLIVP
jgi:hypothetical protein